MKLTYCVVLTFALGLTGCKSEAPPTDAPGPDGAPASGDAAAPRGATPSGSERTASDEPSMIDQPLTMPAVYLSEQHREATKLDVGKQAPQATLPGLDGGEIVVADASNGRLKVISFWQAGDPYSESQLADLQEQIIGQNLGDTVELIAVHVMGDADAAKNAVETAKVTYPVAVDAEAEYFGQWASDFLPRVYLLGPDGKILWFDIGRSADTRHNLQTAIQVSQGK